VRWTAGAALACALLGACTSARPYISAHVVPGTEIDALDHFHVQLHANDRDVGEFITRNLLGRGKRATSGRDRAIPEGTRVIVRYDDSWAWDFTMYLIWLRIEFRDPETNVLLATGASHRVSMVRRDPAEMVGESMQAIFDGGASPFAGPASD
jgi:hypothetical protein